MFGLSPTTSPPLLQSVSLARQTTSHLAGEPNAPQTSHVSVEESIFQARLGPQTVGKLGIADLIAVVHSDGLAALGLPGSNDEG